MKTLKILLTKTHMKFDNLVILLLAFIFFSIVFISGFSSYLYYLSGKQTRDLIREAISKNMTVDSINYLIK
jgi:hypothetical protein